MKTIVLIVLIGLLMDQSKMVNIEGGKYVNKKQKQKQKSLKHRIVNNMGIDSSDSALDMMGGQQDIMDSIQGGEVIENRKMKMKVKNGQPTTDENNNDQQINEISSIMNPDQVGKFEESDDEVVVKQEDQVEDQLEDPTELEQVQDMAEEDKVPLGQECGNQDGDYDKNLQCQGKGICRAYCSRGNEDIEFKKCQFWCVAGDGETCLGHHQCQSEYCQNEVCSQRKKSGETCELKNECLSYSCDQGKCSDIPSFTVPDTFTHVNDKGVNCNAEVEFPTGNQAVLGSCNKVESNDNTNCGYKQNICQDGRCRIRFQNWCYPGNENLDCLNVCQKGSYCIKRYIRKQAYFRQSGKKQKYQYDFEQEMIKAIKNEKQPYQKYQKLIMFFDDMIKVLKTRNTGFQRVAPDQRGSSQFIQSYQCLKKIEDDSVKCSNDLECQSGVCDPSKKICSLLNNDEPCYQNWQCKTGACIGEAEAQKDSKSKPVVNYQCSDKKSDGNECDQGYECQSGLCARNIVACIGKPVPPEDNDYYIKYCQPKGTYILNNECKEDHQCGLHNGLQMKCIRSNVVQKASDKQLGIALDLAIKNIRESFLADNYPQEKYSGDDQVGLEKITDKDWTRDQLIMEMKSLYTFKCKVPTNQKCLVDFECPKNNICKQNVCRGQAGAPCTIHKDCDYSDGLVCAFNETIGTALFGTMTCQNEKVANKMRRLARMRHK